jgi:hypothetical protein
MTPLNICGSIKGYKYVADERLAKKHSLSHPRKNGAYRLPRYLNEHSLAEKR